MFLFKASILISLLKKKDKKYDNGWLILIDLQKRPHFSHLVYDTNRGYISLGIHLTVEDRVVSITTGMAINVKVTVYLYNKAFKLK